MSKIPVGLSASKRRLESAFDDTSENQAPGHNESQSKKANVSISSQAGGLPRPDTDRRKTLSSFEGHLYEADLKELQVKIVALEQDLMIAQNETKKLQIETNSLIDKHKIELRDADEHKRELEKALKNSKMNEKMLSSELEQVRLNLDTANSENGPEKNKQLSLLQQEISDLNHRIQEMTSGHEKALMDLQYELDSKSNQVEEYENEIKNLNEKVKSLSELSGKLDEARKENCLLSNKIHDLESENRSLKDNAENFSSYLDQGQKIETLERENRKLQSEVEYFKATQEKLHFYQEEIQSKTKSIQHLEKLIVSIQVQNSELQEELVKYQSRGGMSTTMAGSSTVMGESMVDESVYIQELESEVLKERERVKTLGAEIRKLKLTLCEKDSVIDDMQQTIARLNSERNGYKKIIDHYDADRTMNDETRPLYKRLDEMEMILSECKKSFGDGTELKLCNNSTFRLENGNVKDAEIQVNLNTEIYAKYDTTIMELKREIVSLRQKNQALESRLKASCGFDSEEIEALKKENTQLKEALSSKEASAKQSSEFEELKKEYKQLQMQKSRFESEFQKSFHQLYQVFRQLFGFKLEVQGDSVRLVSRLNPEHFLHFKINADRSLRLIETEFANYYPNFVDFYLTEHHSIPSFISAIILDSKGFKVDTSM